jgi:hypothetical protein
LGLLPQFSDPQLLTISQGWFVRPILCDDARTICWLWGGTAFRGRAFALPSRPCNGRFLGLFSSFCSAVVRPPPRIFGKVDAATVQTDAARDLDAVVKSAEARERPEAAPPTSTSASPAKSQVESASVAERPNVNCSVVVEPQSLRPEVEERYGQELWIKNLIKRRPSRADCSSS